jgi:hypothetical protein
MRETLSNFNAPLARWQELAELTTRLAELTMENRPTPLGLRAELEDLALRDLLGPASGLEEIADDRSVRGRYILGLLAPRGQNALPEAGDGATKPRLQPAPIARMASPPPRPRPSRPGCPRPSALPFPWRWRRPPWPSPPAGASILWADHGWFDLCASPAPPGRNWRDARGGPNSRSRAMCPNCHSGSHVCARVGQQDLSF